MNILARKGTVNLVKYENGLYGVERLTKACGFGMKYSADKQEVVRKSKNDFNLEIYGR